MTKHVVLKESNSGLNHRVNIPCVIGRSNEADLRGSDPSVSRRHALIVEINNQIWIEDLNSSNGIYINDQKVKEKTVLNPGDSVQMGQTKLLVTQEEEDSSERTLTLHSLDAKAGRELDHERLKIIYEFTAELSENQDITVLGEKISLKFKEIFKQDRSYLALFQEDGTLEPLLFDSSSKSVPLSSSIVKRLFQNAHP